MPLALLLLLAQADAPPADLGAWLASLMYLVVSLAAIVGLLVGVKQLRTKPAEVPSPLTIQEQATFVPLKIYQSDQSVVDARLQAATTSRKAMHQAIEGHAQRLASLEATREHNTQTLASIDTKLTTILQRLPRQP